MPWVRKMYRGGKVWVEVDEQGELVARRGLAGIRYRREDERTYSARASEVLPIDEAVLRREAARRKAARRKEASGRKSAPRLPEQAIVIHTDGACYGNPGPAGIGVVLEWKGRTREISRYLGHATNNIAELTAIKVALEAVKRPDHPVRLHTDSSYSIGVLSRGWKVKENAELVAAIRALMERFDDLKLIKVRGHSGDPRNERADQLARDGIDRQRSAR